MKLVSYRSLFSRNLQHTACALPSLHTYSSPDLESSFQSFPVLKGITKNCRFLPWANLAVHKKSPTTNSPMARQYPSPGLIFPWRGASSWGRLFDGLGRWQTMLMLTASNGLTWCHVVPLLTSRDDLEPSQSFQFTIDKWLTLLHGVSIVPIFILQKIFDVLLAPYFHFRLIQAQSSNRLFNLFLF